MPTPNERPEGKAAHEKGRPEGKAAHDAEEQALIDLLRQGDEDAARAIVDRYSGQMLLLARRRISQRLASRISEEDIVQSSYRTFFRRVKEGQFVFAEQDDLCKLLMRITLHKTLRQIAFHRAAKRDPGHEAEQGDHPRDRLLGILDQDPTPDAEVEFFDQLVAFMKKLTPVEQRILQLRLQGYTTEEIATQLSTPEHRWYDRKVRRCLEHIKAVAEREGLGSAGPTGG